MTAIVLIHGSTQNATCWDRVRAQLAEYETIAVELPAGRPDLTATDFARIAVEQMTGAPDDCVVVAHSASGIFLPRIASMRPVGTLVYLAAMVPHESMSAMQQYEQQPAMLDAEWVAAGPRWSDPANWRDLADEFLFHDVYRLDREWAYSTLRPMRIDAALREPLPAMPRVRSFGVVATRDRTLDPEWQKKTFLEELDGGIADMTNTGHCPHVSSPREAAHAIHIACERSAFVAIDYDTFKARDRQEQIRIFNTITSENRAELVKTQLRRWLAVNRHRLNPEQIALLEEQISFLRAELYSRPRNRELHREQERLIDRMFELFTREDMFHATAANAPHIPPPAPPDPKRR